MTLTTTIWDVEHGSAAISVCPNGKTILFDAGCSDTLSPALAISQLGYGPTNPIDQLVISHPDQDHINDLHRVHDLLKPRILWRNRTIPDSLIYRGPGGAPETEAKRIYKHLHETFTHPVNANDQPAPVVNWGGVEQTHYHLNAGAHPDLSGGNSCNNYSVVSVLSYGVTTIVFPGDIESSGMEALMAETDIAARVAAAPFRVLIAPHHGREAGVCRPFLAAMKPSLTVMSDVHGAETTDYTTYVNYSQGLKVVNAGSQTPVTAKVVTTKTNSAIHLTASVNELLITLY